MKPMRREYKEPYLRKAERRLFLRPFFILPFSLTLLLLALHFFFRSTNGAADFYARRITRPVISFLAPLVSRVPFSLTETGFVFGLFLFVFCFVRACLSLYHLPGKRFRRGIRGAVSLIASALLLFNLFLGFHVLHFHRKPLGEEIGLDPERKPSAQELIKICRSLGEKLNKERETLGEDEQGVYALKDRNELLRAASEGVEEAAKRYETLKPVVQAVPKQLLGSKIFSKMGLGGFFSPFLLEANVNADQPALSFPAAALHELGHLHGYAREDDCEFFAFLTGYLHPRADFRYSAVFLAWDQLMAELKQKDETAWREAYALISPAVRMDIQNRSEYWKRQDGPIREQTEKINDRFLTMSGQESGVRAYGEAAIWIFRWFLKEGGAS